MYFFINYYLSNFNDIIFNNGDRMSYEDIFALEDASIDDLIEELERSELNADQKQRLREIAEGE